MPSTWFIVKPDRQLGPYTSAQMKQLAASGQLKINDQVRRADQETPVAAGGFQELFPENEFPEHPKTTPPPLPSERSENGMQELSEPRSLTSNEASERPKTTPPPLPSERSERGMQELSEPPPLPSNEASERPKTTPPPLPSERTKNDVTADSSGPPPLPSSRTNFDDIRKTLGDLTETIKAAGRLAVAEAHKVQLTKITLPAAYLALGRDIFTNGRFRSELPEMYAEIDRVQWEITRLTTGREAKPGGSFAERAGQTASKFKDVAQAKALGIKVDSLMRRLGEAGYSTFTEKSGPESLVQPISECLNKIGAVDERIRQQSAVNEGSWLTPRRILYVGIGAVALIVLLAVFNRPKSSN